MGNKNVVDFAPFDGILYQLHLRAFATIEQ
jgi:hypothetical protein